MVKTVDYMKYTDAVEAMCDKYCKMPDIAASQDELTDIAMIARLTRSSATRKRTATIRIRNRRENKGNEIQL